MGKSIHLTQLKLLRNLILEYIL